MTKQTSGFVLITVMLMISVMTLLVFDNLKVVYLYLKRHHLYQAYRLSEIQLEEAGLRLIHQKVLNSNDALEEGYPQDALIRQKVLQQGLVFETYYRYLITDLGAYSCVKLLHHARSMINTGDASPRSERRGPLQQHSSHHWLLSMVDKRSPSRVLQLRVATAIPDEVCDWETISYVKAGVMNWRIV